MTSDFDKNVGILALEVYTPRTFIRQSALEEHAGVAAGKFTLGLGQEGLAVTGDAEDVNSLCLTAVHSLLEKYVLPYSYTRDVRPSPFVPDHSDLIIIIILLVIIVQV